MAITQTLTCKGCPDRHIGCHGNCAVYAAYVANIAERNAAIRDYNLRDRMTAESVGRTVERLRKKRR